MDKIKTNMSITGEKRWLEGPLGARPNLDSVPSRWTLAGDSILPSQGRFDKFPYEEMAGTNLII